ncbi:hypothetical protein JDV02_007219 [Purpureocillium takamizusanense]|uniref:Uncharacterized protein n=1 Tax=Purpureocillium takamizusanense TaxID=2060973 RepID=A0A9Q8QM26_9HYPO|nr:uncharacterized protein JDV02_007219 [Purpureocillium takamizusanense]UNI21209.1 hypothetical protein JDV02_007219 [Purpureocillium takamizusanense]
MVRISAFALLAFAVSALAAPQNPATSAAPGQFVDYNGNPLSPENLAKLKEADKKVEKANAELIATFTPEQKKKADESMAAWVEGEKILGAKFPQGTGEQTGTAGGKRSLAQAHKPVSRVRKPF